MRSEVVSIWYVPANDGEETALLIKAPTPTLKALIIGCPIQLLFGKMNNYLCIGIRIKDMPNTPALISGPQIDLEEHKALMQSIKQRKFPIFLFNEMDICVASSSVEITEEISAQLSLFIGNENQLYVGKFNDEVSHAVDCFVHSIDKMQQYQNAHAIPTLEVCVKIDTWKTNSIYFINNDSYNEINIASNLEGANFENTIWGSLESVFPKTLYKSPTVKNGEKVRKFIDVFAFHQYGSFLIEAKDLSVIQAGFNRNETKRLAGIQKQSEKAIKQLVGAVNAFKRGALLFDSKGNEICVDRTIPPHCIVLITELMTSGGWDSITKQLLDAIEETGALFHLLDLREFIILLKQSSGKPELIDYNLVERCKFFCQKRSVFIRGI
ncbi:MAG: hypothetical protein KH056_02385 [Clostridiales bacterium]|nr:hypothetical protein [Clostridiales bacterium]